MNVAQISQNLGIVLSSQEGKAVDSMVFRGLELLLASLQLG